MNRFLFKLLIRDYEKTEDPAVRARYGKLAGAAGILTNLILCSAKIALGLIQGSISVLADGINNLSDASASVITLAGFRLASMPEDRNHPFGHARIEYLTGTIISMIIVFAGLQLLIASAGKIFHPEPVLFRLSTATILSASIGVKFWQMYFYRGTAAAIRSLALRAAAADSRNDAIATSAVLLGLLAGHLAGFPADGFLGCAVSVFIIWSGLRLLWETSSPLVGEGPEEDLVDAIRNGIPCENGILGIHDLVVHNYGPGKIFASVHIEVDARGDLVASHDRIDEIERSLSRDLGIHLVAHLDPVSPDDPLVKKLNSLLTEASRTIDGIAEIHDLRIVPGKSASSVIFDVVVTDDCSLSEEDLRAFFEAHLRRLDPSLTAVITFDRNYVSLSQKEPESRCP